MKQDKSNYNKKWRKRNPTYHTEYNREWRKKNPEKVKEYLIQQRLRHPEYKGRYKDKYYKDKYREKNKERQREHRKYLKSHYGIGIATIRRYGLKLALEVYDKFNRRCVECGEENDLTIHHLDGKGRNYEEKGLKPNHKIENLILICRRCHGSIHGKQSKGIKKSKTLK